MVIYWLTNTKTSWHSLCRTYHRFLRQRPQFWRTTFGTEMMNDWHGVKGVNTFYLLLLRWEYINTSNLITNVLFIRTMYTNYLSWQKGSDLQIRRKSQKLDTENQKVKNLVEINKWWTHLESSPFEERRGRGNESFLQDIRSLNRWITLSLYVYRH